MFVHHKAIKALHLRKQNHLFCGHKTLTPRLLEDFQQVAILFVKCESEVWWPHGLWVKRYRSFVLGWLGVGEDFSLPQSLSQSNCINQGNGKFNAEGEVTNAMD